MLSGGDEIGRTQKGNNNAYCQDNDLSWNHWDLSKEDSEFLEYVRKIIKIRKGQLAIHRKDFFKGIANGQQARDIVWIGINGLPMQQADWLDPSHKVLGVLIEKDGIQEIDVKSGAETFAHTLLMLTNSSHIDMPFSFPKKTKGSWRLLVDTAEPEFDKMVKGKSYYLKARSFALFELVESTASDLESTASGAAVPAK